MIKQAYMTALFATVVGVSLAVVQFLLLDDISQAYAEVQSVLEYVAMLQDIRNP